MQPAAATTARSRMRRAGAVTGGIRSVKHTDPAAPGSPSATGCARSASSSPSVRDGRTSDSWMDSMTESCRPFCPVCSCW